MDRNDLLVRAFLAGGFFGIAFGATFTAGFFNTASYWFSVPILLVVWIACHKYWDRLLRTKTSETPTNHSQHNQLSVVHAQTVGIHPPLKIRVSINGRSIGMHTFNKDVITVGRDPKSDIHLDNVNVAREHLRFEYGPSGYYTLVDMGSSQGTFLNDEAVSRGYVYNNDVVRIGSYTLWIGFQADTRNLVG